MMNGFGGMWFGWIFWIIIVVAVVWVVIQFSSRNQQNPPGNKPVESPMDILKKRYANGEITKDEFERMKKDLM